MRKVLYVFALFIVAISQAVAQEQGLYPGITYDSDIIGNVNLTTGSLAIQHTLLKLPQWKGFNLGDLSLRYNTPTWTQVTYTDASGYEVGRQWMPTSNSTFSVYPYINGSDGVMKWEFTTLPDADGNPSAQKLYATTSDGSVHDLVPSGGAYHSIDGSNITVNSTGTQLIDSNGTTYSITVPTNTAPFGTIVPASNAWAWGSNGSGAYPMTVTNVHGQTLNRTYGTSGMPIYGSDSVGRTWYAQVTSDYSGCTGPLTIGLAFIYSLQDQQGTQHPVFKECMVAIPLVTNFGDCGSFGPCDFSDMGDMGQPGAASWLQSIVFTPDGNWSTSNAWTFLYGRTDFSSSNYVNIGVLTGIKTPQGATITYNWDIGSCMNGPCPQVQSRVLNAGDGSGNQTTSYSYSFSNPFSTTVTNPDLSVVVHQFEWLTNAELSTSYLTPTGSVLESVSRTYQSVLNPYNQFLSQYPFYANSWPTSETTTWPNGVSCATQTTYPNGYNWSVTFLETAYNSNQTFFGFAPNGEAHTVSTYDCSSSSGALLSTTQDVWMDANTNYYNQNLFGLLQQESTYDGSGNLVSQTTNGYDQNGESSYVGDLTSSSQWINTGGTLSTSTTYDSTGNPIHVIDPSNNTTTIGYDSTNLVPTLVTHPPVPSGVTLQTLSGVDPFTYMPTSHTDVAGAGSTQSYDGMFRPTGGTLENNAQYSYTYVPYSVSQLPKVIVTTQIDNNSTTTTQTVMDGFGRTIQSNTQTNNGSQIGWYQQDTCYDNMGRVSFTSYPYVTWSTTPAAHSCSMAGDTISYEWLSNGRRVRTTHQDATYSSVVYIGRATQTTDEMGVSRITQVDGLGRPTIVCEISSTPSMPSSESPTNCGTDISGTGFVTSFAYNLASHTTTITQGAQQRVFQTDSLGRTIYTSEPERGVTTVAYSYNSTGLHTVRTRPRANQTSANVYTTTTTQADSIGRTISVSYANSDGQGAVTPSRSFTYDTLSSPAWSVPLGYSYGRLVLASTASASTQIGGYDALGYAGNTVQCLPDWCGQSSHDVRRWYQYDLRGQLTQEQYMTQASSGATISVNTGHNLSGGVAYVSGGQNNASTLMDPSNNPILFQVTQNGAFGLLAGQYGNGLGIAATYDSLGRMQSAWVCSNGVASANCPGATNIYNFSSLSWAGGYLSTSADSALAQASSYGYDAFGRLSTTNINSGSIVFSYQYDRYGNRWSQIATGTSSASVPQPNYSFNSANNQLQGNSYDAVGNVLNDGFHSYNYDAEGNIVSVDGTAQYVYDAFNQLVKVTSANGTVQRFAYNLGGQRVSTWDVSGNLVTAKYYVNGNPIAYYSNTDGYLHFEHQDWLGTERVRTCSSGSIEGSYASLPFGDAFTVNGKDTDPYHFAGLDHDADSYTEHAEFRQYSSAQGRWLSPDPSGGSYDMGNPQSLNRYVYVLNNPLSMTDPSGLDPACKANSNDGAPIGNDNNCMDATFAQKQNGTWKKELVCSPCGAILNALKDIGSAIDSYLDSHGEPSPYGLNSNSGFNFGGPNGISPLPAGGAQAQQQGQQGINNQLKYKTLLGGQGTNPWQIEWGLTHRTKVGGWIVQHIVAYSPGSTLCNGSGNCNYWEAWQVPANSRKTSTLAAYGYDDQFSSLTADGQRVAGTHTHASARFYEGLTLPTSFHIYPRAAHFPAGILRATTTDPNLSTENATAPVVRWWMSY